MHMGVLHSEDSQESAVAYNIENARQTVYSLMSAGFHGHNGLYPETFVHLLQTYVIPILVYGLELVFPRKVLIEKLEKFLRKMLKLIFSLLSRLSMFSRGLFQWKELYMLVHCHFLAIFVDSRRILWSRG